MNEETKRKPFVQSDIDQLEGRLKRNKKTPVPELRQQTIERAQRILAMCNVLQYEMDELVRDKAFFRHELKMTGKNFMRELDKQVKELYDAMDHDANVYYNSQITALEELLKAYTQGKVEVIEDSDDNVEEWICTDPDNGQYMRKLNVGIYEFKQRYGTSWVKDIICLDDYTHEQMWEYCLSYYTNEEFNELLQSDAAIIAECIFESTNF